MRPDTPQKPAEPPVIAALRALVDEHPDLAPAADLQIEIAQITRRVSARAPLPRLSPVAERQRAVESGSRVLAFADLRFDWSAIRLAIREVARALSDVGALSPEDLEAAGQFVRGETGSLERLVEGWFDDRAGSPQQPPLSEGLHELLDTALRPFLARAASAALTGVDLDAWNRPACPACGGEADVAVILRDGRRCLSCHRCRAQWPWHAWACPRCGNDARETIASFASRDGLYRIYACGTCQRYVKAYDSRQAPRPFLPEVDLIATLPLDAAAMQKGFTA